MAKQGLKDWVIMFHVGLAVDTILYLMVQYHDSAVVIGSGTGALPLILGLYHWFTQRDDKIPDADDAAYNGFARSASAYLQTAASDDPIAAQLRQWKGE